MPPRRSWHDRSLTDISAEFRPSRVQEFYLDGDSLKHAGDATFTALAIAEPMRTFGARSNGKTIFEVGLLSNL